MSQHYCELATAAGLAVGVTLGFDRPLQGFFMIVRPADDPSEPLYSNLHDPELAMEGGMSTVVTYFLDKLTDLGINVPQPMVTEVMADAANNVGNRVVFWDHTGHIVRQAA